MKMSQKKMLVQLACTWKSGTAFHLLTWLMKWSCGTDTWQTKIPDQSCGTVKKCLSRAEQMDQKFASVLVPGKFETGNGNVVHPEEQRTNWKDFGIACNHWADNVGPWCTCLESVVDRKRGYDLKKGMPILVRKRQRSAKDRRRL